MDFDIKRGGEPPNTVRGTVGKYSPIADAARETPGEWVSVDDISANVAGSINAGKTKGFEPTENGHFEAVGRNVRDNRCTLWVRYLKNEEDSA